MAKHIGNIDTVIEHDHATLASIFDCTHALCVSLLTAPTRMVEYVGKHGVRYARGNN